MIGLGFGLFFGGYWLLTYGFSQVKGCNAGFFSLAWPGSFQGCNPDAGPTGPNLGVGGPTSVAATPAPKGAPPLTPYQKAPLKLTPKQGITGNYPTNPTGAV